MWNSTSFKVVCVVIVAALLTEGYFVWKTTNRPLPVQTSPQNQTNQLGYASSTGQTIVVTALDLPHSNVAPPTFAAPITYEGSVSADVRTALNQDLAKVQAALQKSKNDMNNWLQLGVLYKMGGDYNDAERIWQYVSAAWPHNTISFVNLGDLYMNFLQDYKKAESSYLKAIHNDPGNVENYINLFTLYSGLYTSSPSAAENILKNGIAANPQSYQLQLTLARYYVSKGRTADAKVQYDAAIANAKHAGQPTIAADIQKEETSQ